MSILQTIVRRNRYGAVAMLLLGILGVSRGAYANHGPGSAGGGATTQSAEILKPGTFAFGYRVAATRFKRASRAKILGKAAKAGSFDATDTSFLHTVSLDYGVAQDAQVGLSIGYFDSINTREGEVEMEYMPNETVLNHFNPDGLTDLWLRGKYRFLKGRQGQVAAFGGVKLPTGRDRVRNSAGEFVEPADTPGTGAVDGMAGLAYSRWLTERITLDASGQYTRRGSRHKFKLGDRVDAGVAVAYRLTEDIEKHPQVNVFAECTLRYLFKDRDRGHLDPNSGGATLFVAPGVRVGITEHVTVTISPQFPAIQNLYGKQLKTQFKVISALTVTF